MISGDPLAWRKLFVIKRRNGNNDDEYPRLGSSLMTSVIWSVKYLIIQSLPGYLTIAVTIIKFLWSLLSIARIYHPPSEIIQEEPFLCANKNPEMRKKIYEAYNPGFTNFRDFDKTFCSLTTDNNVMACILVGSQDYEIRKPRVISFVNFFSHFRVFIRAYKGSSRIVSDMGC